MSHQNDEQTKHRINTTKSQQNKKTNMGENQLLKQIEWILFYRYERFLSTKYYTLINGIKLFSHFNLIRKRILKNYFKHFLCSKYCSLNFFFFLKDYALKYCSLKYW